jgi:hypothetical protein
MTSISSRATVGCRPAPSADVSPSGMAVFRLTATGHFHEAVDRKGLPLLCLWTRKASAGVAVNGRFLGSRLLPFHCHSRASCASKMAACVTRSSWLRHTRRFSLDQPHPQIPHSSFVVFVRRVFDTTPTIVMLPTDARLNPQNGGECQPGNRSLTCNAVEMALFGTKWHGLGRHLSRKANPLNELREIKKRVGTLAQFTQKRSLL